MNRWFFKARRMFAVMLLAVMLVPARASASGNLPITEDTVADVDFIKGDSAPALDPDDPSKPLPGDVANKESGNTITGQSGDITINVLPKLDFGQNEIDFMQKDFYALLPVRPYLQVTDLRGTGDGWSLTVKASRFTTTKDGNPGVNTLKDSVIHLKNGKMKSSNADLMNAEKMPEINNDISIKCSGEATDEVEVINAKKSKNQGMGAWVARWYPIDKNDKHDTTKTVNENAYLTIPVRSIESGKHTVTLTWTLVNSYK